jgi:predicted ArsR family transcriptional regulator
MGCNMPSDNSSRLLYTLKSRGPLATSALARALGIIVVGIRHHLAKLHARVSSPLTTRRVKSVARNASGA